MKIEELLEKYFEGETTCAEEQELRHFFSTENVPEHLNCYRPLFLCLETECRKQNEIRSEKNVPKQNHQEPTKPDSIRRNHRRQLYIWGAGIAASLLIAAGMGIYLQKSEPKQHDTFTNPALAYQETQRALQLFATALQKGEAQMVKAEKTTLKVQQTLENITTPAGKKQ